MSAEDNFYYLQQLPLVIQLTKENKKLKRRVKELKRLVRLISNNLPLFEGKKHRTQSEDIEEVECDSVDEIEIIDVDENLPVQIKQEKKDNIELVIMEVVQSPPIEVQEKDVVVQSEEAEEEEAVEEEEEAVEEEEEAVEEEEEAVEEEEEEAAAEEEEVEEEEDADEEVYEVIIKGKTYYTSNEKSGIIYGVDENGDVSLEVGVYKDGKPIFKK